MCIDDSRKERILFKDMKPGDAFEAAGGKTICMKTQKNGFWNAIDLMTGCFARFHGDTELTKINLAI